MPPPDKGFNHCLVGVLTRRGFWTWWCLTDVVLGLIVIFTVTEIGKFSSWAEPPTGAWETTNAAGMQAYRQGRYTDAKRWFLQALTEAEQGREPNPSQAMTLNNLAAVHEALGETREAELRYQQSLSVIEAIQGANHPDLVPALNNLALLYAKEGDVDQAEPLLRRSLRILELHLGPNHAHLIPSIMTLAQLTLSQGRFEEAERFYSRALDIADAELSPDHQQTVEILEGYATLLRQMNRDKEANLLQERAKAVKDSQGPQPGAP